MTNQADPQVAHWHGFTQMADHDSLIIEHAEGCWLTTADGEKLFDGVSSLWCNVHGHRHATLDSAIEKQLGKVAHITTLGMSCQTTEDLASRLSELTPGDLAHVFFSSDGSSAVEAALKMSFQYWQQRDDPRPQKTRFLALGSAYHGDTTGAVSLGGINKVLGGIFGVSKYILLISILLVFVDQFSFMFEFFESNFLEESVMFESLKNVGYYIIQLLESNDVKIPEKLV